MNYEQINKLTIEDCIDILRYRLNLEEDQETIYQDYEDEFVIYKAELIVEEDARLAEIARKADLMERFQVIKNRDSGCPAFYQIKTDTPNYVRYIFDLIADKSREVEAEAFMIQLEAKDAELVTFDQTNEYKELRKDEYPITGDQLDLIFKTFKYLHDSGVNIGNDGRSYVDAIQLIKDNNPKPE